MKLRVIPPCLTTKMAALPNGKRAPLTADSTLRFMSCSVAQPVVEVFDGKAAPESDPSPLFYPALFVISHFRIPPRQDGDRIIYLDAASLKLSLSECLDDTRHLGW